MAFKYFYYVLIATGDGAKLVTKVDHATKTAYWDGNEKPMSFTKFYAEDLALGLTLNCNPAFTIKSYHELKTQIFLPMEKQNEEK